MDRRSTSAPDVRPDRRLDGKVAIVVGAGQTPGQTVGNGRAASILFARHGARVLLVDRDLGAAEATGQSFATRAARPRRCRRTFSTRRPA